MELFYRLLQASLNIIHTFNKSSGTCQEQNPEALNRYHGQDKNHYLEVVCNKNHHLLSRISSALLVHCSLQDVAVFFSQKGVAFKYSSSGMTETPPTQSCSQTCCNTNFMKNQLCPGGHFFITGCLNKAHTKINIFIHRHTAYLTKKEIKNILLVSNISLHTYLAIHFRYIISQVHNFS